MPGAQHRVIGLEFLIAIAIGLAVATLVLTVITA
jgi:hypothetical protein